MNDDDLGINETITIVEVSCPNTPMYQNKSLQTKRPYNVCDNYDHYSHDFPLMTKFWESLGMLHQVDAMMKIHNH